MSLEKIVNDNTDAIKGLTAQFQGLLEHLQPGATPAQAPAVAPDPAANDADNPPELAPAPAPAKKVRKPRKAAAEPTPEPGSAPASADPELTLADVQKAWLELAKHKKAKATVLLKKTYNAPKVSDVPPDRWPALMAEIADAMPQ